jgi:predicted phosphodiesterase
MRESKLKLYTCVAILSVFCSVAYSANEIEKGPYLQNVGKKYITIMWETTYATKSQVDYGITEDCNLFVEDAKEVKLHEVTLYPLRANTRYYYKITCSLTTKTGSFKTAPNHNIPFNFAVYGDSRANPDIHRKVAEGILAANPDIILHVGDLVNDGSKDSLWESQFFEPLHDVINHIPIFTCLGNHEKNDKNYFNLFSLPNNESWYSFSYSNCHFIVLDTNKDYGKGSQQYKWLKDDLGETQTKWIFVFFHHPPYGSGTHHASSLEVRNVLTPLFRKYGVDIVFSGHDHNYGRSYPIGSAFESKQTPVTYIVTGGGGGPLHNTNPDTWTASTQKINNFCIVNVDGEELNFKALDTNGNVLDKFAIAKEKDKYQQYLKKAIPYEQIEFERMFPNNITPPVVLLEKGKTSVQSVIKIKNPFSYLVDVKIVWHHLNDWNLKPRQAVVRISSKKTARIPFTFYSPELNNIWPPPKFSVLYDTKLGSGKVTDNYLKILLPRELSCNINNTPLVLDGRLKEQFWTNASPANTFIQVDGSGPAKKQTIAKVARSKNEIYFALICNESEPKNLSADVTKRDGDIENDDAVIVSIAPHNNATTQPLNSPNNTTTESYSLSLWERDGVRVAQDDATTESSRFQDDATTEVLSSTWFTSVTSEDEIIYQFGVNCKGVEYDSKSGHKEWNGKWKSSTRINERDWTVEMAIPYSVLELLSPPEKGSRWKINFCRSTTKPAEKSEWSTTLSSPLSAQTFGALIMN